MLFLYNVEILRALRQELIHIFKIPYGHTFYVTCPYAVIYLCLQASNAYLYFFVVSLIKLLNKQFG